MFEYHITRCAEAEASVAFSSGFVIPIHVARYGVSDLNHKFFISVRLEKISVPVWFISL
jgi:hypothetical protein